VALKLVRTTGAAVLVLALILFVVMPKAPVTTNVPGFRGAVVGFELASEPDHVFGILGDPHDPRRPASVRAMDLTNRLDFLFMLAYPAFFFALACLLVARGSAPSLLAPIVAALAVTMSVTDALENRQLLALSQMTDPVQMSEPLRLLRQFTVAKWGAIFIASGLLAVFVWRERSPWRWSAPVFGVATLLAASALTAPSWLEPAANVLAVAWLMSWVQALRFRSRA